MPLARGDLLSGYVNLPSDVERKTCGGAARYRNKKRELNGAKIGRQSVQHGGIQGTAHKNRELPAGIFARIRRRKPKYAIEFRKTGKMVSVGFQHGPAPVPKNVQVTGPLASGSGNQARNG